MADETSAVAPVILTLLLCERIILDRSTNQLTLIQLIQNFNSPKFPARVPRWFLYSEFTGCHGPVSISFRIVDVDEELDPVCQLDFQAHQDNPLLVAHTCFQLPNMVFPKEGEYRVQAVAGTAAPLEKRLTARKLTPPQQPTD